MTDQEIIQKIQGLLPEGERYDRAYRAFEGGVRVISKDQQGRERRYSFTRDGDTISIQPM